MGEDYDVNELGFTLGHVTRMNPYEGLTDEQADALQAELDAKQARKLPIGFRATRARKGASRRDWPVVPRFDIREDS